MTACEGRALGDPEGVPIESTSPKTRDHGELNVSQRRNEINDRVPVKSPVWEGASERNQKHKPTEFV